MAIVELDLEKVLDLVPELKDYKLSSVVLVDGELHTVSDSSVPFELMELAETKILQGARDGYFCDATECDCTGVCTFNKSNDDDECHDWSIEEKSVVKIDAEKLKLSDLLYDEDIFTQYNHTHGVSFEVNKGFVFLADGAMVTWFCKRNDGYFSCKTYGGHEVDLKDYKDLRMVTQTESIEI